MAEFKQKLKALHTQLDEGEMQTLFQHLDKANRGFIDYQSFVTEFPEINSKLVFIEPFSFLHDSSDQAHHLGLSSSSGEYILGFLHGQTPKKDVAG
jgi:hypothetical protein